MPTRFLVSSSCVVALLILHRPAAAQPSPRGDLGAAAARAQRSLVARYGEAERGRIARGLAQAAALWQPSDGDAAAYERFVTQRFVPAGAELDATQRRFEEAFEQLDGQTVELQRALRRRTDLELGPLLEVDKMFAGVDPGAHTLEDLFRAKLAFVVLLNFPLTTLDERTRLGATWSRQQWAAARLAGRFFRRVPAAVNQRLAEAGSRAELYIAEYNLHLHHVVDRFDLKAAERPFPRGLRLISHWNLRDELKGRYGTPDALRRQRLIARVMERIVDQSIPQAVIDNPAVDWNPLSNEVRPAPRDTVEHPAAQVPPRLDAREPDTRYARWLECFQAARAANPYSPTVPTLISRRFEVERELPEARVKAMLEEILDSPLVPRVARLIERRLGRPLEPFDIWYAGFRPRTGGDEADLDARVKARYPNVAAFQKDLPRLLQKLGFSPAKAQFLSRHIVVDPARGAGHAWGAMRREDEAHLRTRILPGGMNYKGYNIAVHELGHNVEQVFSLHEVDHTLLQGVPNTAFTEAIAFVFQARDRELLGLGRPTEEAERLRVVNDLWMTYEIAGVALVDMAVWHWLYDHPRATAAELRQAVLRLARDVWNRYYAKVLGQRDVPLLAVYSHLISNFLYVPDYPLGHIIAHQIEEHLKQAGKLGPAIERMTRLGAVMPDLWMQHATGQPITPALLLRAAERALPRVEAGR